MKKITFKKGISGRYYTYQFNGVYQDKPSYLEDLARISTMFEMLLHCTKFNAIVGNNKINGYTDKYGNKIIKYV